MKMSKTGMLSLVCVIAACNGQGGADDEAITLRVGALGGTARFNFVKTADWGAGYNARVDITNIGSTQIQGWSADFDMPKNVQANLSSIPLCSASVTDNCYSVVSDIGPENIVRIFHTGSANTINVGQTRSEFLFGSYEGAFGFPTRCGAPLTGQSTPCNGSNDVTAPSAASNLSIFGTGSTLVDLFWNNATDDVGVTGYILRYATQAAPALEIGEVPFTAPITRARITRLVSDTNYIFFVEARDAAGNCRAVHRLGGDAHRAAADHRHVQHRQHLAGRRLPGRVPGDQHRVGAARQLAVLVLVHGQLPVGVGRRGVGRSRDVHDLRARVQHHAGSRRDRDRRRDRPVRQSRDAAVRVHRRCGQPAGPRAGDPAGAVPRSQLPERPALLGRRERHPDLRAVTVAPSSLVPPGGARGDQTSVRDDGGLRANPCRALPGFSPGRLAAEGASAAVLAAAKGLHVGADTHGCDSVTGLRGLRAGRGDRQPAAVSSHRHRDPVPAVRDRDDGAAAVAAAALVDLSARGLGWQLRGASPRRRSVSFILMTEVANYARALLAAWGVSRFGDSGGRLDTLKGMTAFLLFGVVLAPCAGAFIGAGAVALHGGGYLVSLRPWLLSNVLTGLTLLPVLLIVRARLVAKLGWVPLHRWREAGILLIALLGVGGLVLLDSNASGASLYAPLPLLLWAAVRFGPGGTSAAVLTVAILAITGTLGERGPFVMQSPEDGLLQLQLFLFVVSVPLLLLSALLQEQRRTADELRASQQQYRTIVEDQTELICRFRPDGTLTFVNGAFGRAMGRAPEELLGSFFWSFVPPEPRDTQSGLLAGLTPASPLLTWEQRLLGGPAGNRWEQWRVRALFDDAGRVVDYQAVGRDITERKRAEEEHAMLESQRAHAAALREADRRKDEFLAMLAHELRNPLAPIAMAVEILRHVPLERRAHRLRPGHHRAADRPARASGGRSPGRRAHHQRFDPAPDGDGRPRSHHFEHSRNQPAVDRGAPAEGRHRPARRPADRAGRYGAAGAAVLQSGQQRRQVLRDRRAHHRSPSSARRRTSSSASRTPAPGSRATCSNEFLSRSRRCSVRGTRRWAGWVWVWRWSRSWLSFTAEPCGPSSGGPGTGSEFVVRLPAAEAVAEEHSLGDRPAPDPADLTPALGATPLRILVVDDVEDAAESLADFLRLQGDTVHVARDGRSALELAAQVGPEVVFVDLQMPEIDGLEVARRLRGRGGLPRTLLVAVTGLRPGRKSAADRGGRLRPPPDEAARSRAGASAARDAARKRSALGHRLTLAATHSVHHKHCCRCRAWWLSSGARCSVWWWRTTTRR